MVYLAELESLDDLKELSSRQVKEILAMNRYVQAQNLLFAAPARGSDIWVGCVDLGRGTVAKLPGGSGTEASLQIELDWI